MLEKIATGGCLGDGVRWVGDPVDVVTGALVEAVGELTIAGPLPIVWERYYSTSRTAMEGPLGWAHTHGYDRSLRAAVDGWLLRQPDGGSLLFPYDAPTQPQGGWHLERLAGEMRVRAPDGTVYVFREPAVDRPARPGQIVRGADALTLAYDREGRLVELGDRGRERVLAVEYGGARVTRLVLLAHPTRTHGRPLVMMRYEYDARGDLVAATDRHGHRRTFTYDAAHRMIARTDRDGYRFEYEYDVEGRCVASRGHDGVQAVALRYMPEMRATVVRRADGGEWLHRHDETLSITEILDPYGGSRRFEYDAEGRLVAETDPGGNRRTALHDAAGAVTAWINAAGGVRPAADPTGPPAHRVPRTAAELELGDLAPEVLRQAPLASAGLEPLMTGGASIFSEVLPERDPRVESRCRRDEQGILSAEACEGGAPRRWTYTPNGWVRSYVDHDGSRYEFEYTSWNHRVLARDPLGRELRYEYTPGEQIAAVVDPAGNRHEYRHDLRDALTEVRHAGSLVESYQYDRAGNLVAKRDARGALLVEYEYGAENLKSRRKLADGEQHRYEYAPNGRFARVSYGEHALEFAYATNGRRCRDLRDGRGVEHRFDGGRLTETRVLGRFVTRYRRLDARTLEVEDPLGNRHAMVLEPEGTVIRRMACGTHELVQFDALGRVLGKHLFNPDAQTSVWRRRFEYSPEGDLLRVEDSERGTTRYRHDAAHQLAEVAAPDGRGSGTYRYDLGGNLVEAPHLAGVEVAPGNKLVRANGGTLTHDHRNNVSLWQRDGRDLRFHRDALDQLRRIDGLDAPWSADYDPLGRRTRKTYGSETTEYFWDTDRLAAELRPGGQLRVYVYADDFSLTPWLAIDYDSLDAEPASGELHYLVTDQRGAPVAALDADGRRVWSARLEPYGLAEIERAEGSQFELSLRLAGQLHDAETGLHYNRFRYYSPELGRYLEEDPAGTGGGSNIYKYTSNPLVQFDPRGLDCEHCKSKDHKSEDCPKKKAAEEARQKEIQDQLKKLAEEGHGPQRHGSQITQQQLTDRAMHGKDPMTGTTTDGVHGGTHGYSKDATKINSDESYVAGENKLRNSDEFRRKTADADDNAETRVVIEDQKLEDIYGPDYKDHVSGQTRQGSRNDPTGTTPTDFTDGTMTGIYDKDPGSGDWKLVTMYPDPKT